MCINKVFDLVVYSYCCCCSYDPIYLCIIIDKFNLYTMIDNDTIVGLN